MVQLANTGNDSQVFKHLLFTDGVSGSLNYLPHHKGYIELAQLLLDTGADVNAPAAEYHASIRISTRIQLLVPITRTPATKSKTSMSRTNTTMKLTKTPLKAVNQI
jgi:hypothetical protein